MIHTLPVAPPSRPDVACAALPLLRRFRDTLQAVARFRELCRTTTRNRWGEPEVFFFEPDVQVEWEVAGPPADQVPAEVLAAASRRDPAGASACIELAEVADDMLTVLAAGAEVRHTARAVPGLREAAQALAAEHPKARQITAVLAATDDEVVRVIHPAARAGFQVLVRGVADLAQFHVLLADAVTGSPAHGLLPGPRPDPQVLAAYRDAPALDRELVATARFQFVHPRALRPDGTVPAGFAASDDWLWGPESLTAVPKIDGERSLLITEPAVRTTWDAVRKLPWVTGELEVIEVMTEAEVEGWLGARLGRPLAPHSRPVLRVA